MSASKEGRPGKLVMLFAVTAVTSFSSFTFILYHIFTSQDKSNNTNFVVSPFRWFGVTFSPLLVACYGLLRGTLSRSGAIAAIMVGATLTLAHLGFFFGLLAFFLTASRATRFRAEEKRSIEGATRYRGAGGKRDWLQGDTVHGPADTRALLCNPMYSLFILAFSRPR